MRDYDPTWDLRQIIDRIAETFRSYAHWMGYYTIRARGRLGTCDPEMFRAAMQHMLYRGLILAISPPEAEYPVYILASLTYRAGRRRSKGGAR